MSSAKNNKKHPKYISGQIAKRVKKQQQQNQNRCEKQRGVMLIKHLPRGFYEDEIKNYFKQFGKVTRLRLVRSRRNGGVKGYAFVEFEYPEIAQVAAETMNNYLMFNKLVKAVYIPPEEQKFNYFKSSVRLVKNKAGKDIYVSKKTTAAQKKVIEHNDWTEDTYQKRTKSDMKKIELLNSKYSHLGVDFSKLVIKPIPAQSDKYDETEVDLQKTNFENLSSVTKREDMATGKPKIKPKVPKSKDRLEQRTKLKTLESGAINMKKHIAKKTTGKTRDGKTKIIN